MMPEQSFEKAISDLEKIVEKLEKGDLSLNESLAQFEEGVKLAKFLREELDKAEKKIEILLKDEKGNIRAESFSESEEEPEKEEDNEDSGANDDIPF
jgi:exodeoxyribonuclease VII small subunit